MHIIFRIILYISWISMSVYGAYSEYSKNLEFKKHGVLTKAKIIDFYISISKWRKDKKMEKQYMKSVQSKVLPDELKAKQKTNNSRPHSPKSN